MTVNRLTLDTNILRDWAWCEGRSTESRYTQDAEAKRRELRALFEKLTTLRDTGVCEIGITTRLYMDYGKGSRELPQYMSDMIGPYVRVAPPDMSDFPLSFPVVFPRTEQVQQVQRIFEDVFPHSKPGHGRYLENQKDAWQLYAHQVAGRDTFITQDKGILRMRSVLADKWGIHVKSLREYVLEATSRVA